jgi:integrase
MPRKTFTFEGKRYSVTAKTETDLAVRVAMKKRDLEDGKKSIGGHITVQTWIRKFLETYIEGAVADSTLDANESLLRNFVIPKIGNMRIKDVKEIHCQNIMKAMEGYSNNHIRKVRSILKRMLETARKNGLILENPAIDITLPKRKRDGTHRPITDREREITLAVAKTHRCGLWIKTALYTGIRPGEAAALQGRHIDLKEAKLHIEQARKKTGRIGEAKTEAGERVIPIPDILLQDLIKLRPEPFEYIFKNKNGGRMSASNMTKAWASFKRQMQIEAGCRVVRNELVPPLPIADDLVPYCYRHTYCTDLQEAGVPLNIAKYLMGHTDIRMTANLYTHTTGNMLTEALESMNRHHNALQS